MYLRRQMPYIVVALLSAAACAPVLPTPDDFPGPPLTPIIEFPTTPLSTAPPQPRLKPMFADDMPGARTFFLILKVGMIAGDSASVADRVYYPIQVLVNGQAITIRSATEFERNYESIFNSQLREAIAGAQEDDLELHLDGVQAAGGALWFNHFCEDAACTQGQFLITQINN